MKKELFIDFIIILALALLPENAPAQLQQLCGGTSTTVMNSEYNLMNNIWGSGAGVGEQCIEFDPSRSYFKVIVSTHNNGSSVAAYPAIFKGCHWGWCTTKDNPMPVKLSEIESAPFNWAVTTTGVSGTWNAALDLWFNDNATGTDYNAELMIWIDYHGGATPGGTQRATVDIGGYTWDVYFAVWNWNYIAYRIVSPVDSVSFDLRDFFHDSIQRGYLYTPWYLNAIEAGFEIFSGGQGLTSRSFSTSVTEGATLPNYAPMPFTLYSPRDNATVDSLTVSFRWQPTEDPDLQPVEYIVHLSGQDSDTTIAGLTETSLDFDGSHFLQYNSSYTWYVEATDGMDTTKSSVERTFKTPNATSVDLVRQVPRGFLLMQNSPNPFNAATEICFEIENSTRIDLSVYDVLGKKVVTLAKGFYPAGSYRTVFNASGLSSGVYYYQLTTPQQQLRRKCLCIK
jgi:hypothetical protein